MSQVPDEAICWKGCRAAFTTCSATSQWPEGGRKWWGSDPKICHPKFWNRWIVFFFLCGMFLPILHWIISYLGKDLICDKWRPCLGGICRDPYTRLPSIKLGNAMNTLDLSHIMSTSWSIYHTWILGESRYNMNMICYNKYIDDMGLASACFSWMMLRHAWRWCHCRK